MRTPARIAKHPIHPMLVPIPIGLWLFSFVCDLVFRLGNGGPNWEIVAWYTMVGGIVGALAAAVPGVIDMLSVPQAVKRTALVHMTLNLTIVVLYAINAWLRRDGITDGLIALSLVAILLLLVSGWLGGKMVYEQGAGVDPGAERHAAHRYSGPERRRGIASRYAGPERRLALR